MYKNSTPWGGVFVYKENEICSRKSEQSCFGRLVYELGGVGGTCLLEQPLSVPFDGLMTERDDLRYLLACAAGCDQLQYLSLA